MFIHAESVCRTAAVIPEYEIVFLRRSVLHAEVDEGLQSFRVRHQFFGRSYCSRFTACTETVSVYEHHLARILNSIKPLCFPHLVVYVADLTVLIKDLVSSFHDLRIIPGYGIIRHIITLREYQIVFIKLPLVRSACHDDEPYPVIFTEIRFQYLFNIVRCHRCAGFQISSAVIQHDSSFGFSRIAAGSVWLESP